MESTEPMKTAVFTGVKCEVCGEQASGYHYGVDTCSACKIFFRRNCDRPVKHRCEKGNKVRKSRRKYAKPQVLTCPGCRMQKCMQAGMAVEAIRKGRYTYSVKYEYFKKTQKKVESDGLDEEGNSTDNRTSSESSDIQVSDCTDILAYSIEKELLDLEASSESSPSLTTSEPTYSPGPDQFDVEPPFFPQEILPPIETFTTYPTDVSTDQTVTEQHKLPQHTPESCYAVTEETSLAVVPFQEQPVAAIYREPNSILDDVEKLSSRLSEMFISCGTFSPGFFERISDIEQCYVNHKLMNPALDAKIIPPDEYKAYYDKTGIDVDGRQEKMTNRFLSLERRLRSYVTFVKKIQGFAELPKIDQERLFKAGHTEISCLSEYRSYNVCLGLRTLPEGIVLDYQDLLCQSHSDYVDLLFNMAERLQKLNLTEGMCNLLKCTALFSPEFCVTEIGREKTAKQQNMMLRALELLLRHKHAQGEDALSKALIIMGDMKILRHRCIREVKMTSKEFPKIYTPQLVHEVCSEFEG